MNLYITLAILMVTVTLNCESKVHDFGGKHDYKTERKSSIHLNTEHHHHNKNRLRGSHLDLKEGGTHSVHDDWMKPTKGTECLKETKCGHKEFCIRNPATGEEKCVNKRGFKESRRLFRNFHKQKKLMQQDSKYDLLDKNLKTADHMKEVYDLLKDYNKYEKHMGKKIHIKTMMEKSQPKFPVEAAVDTPQECRPTELYELRKRMVGWFVLLHTESRRDHHKKKHRKNMLKHQNKHSSTLDSKDHVKNSLSKRSVHDFVEVESHHNCKCSKSAMWEFHHKDTNKDGYLSHEELEYISANKREPCMKPLFKSCDTDKDGSLSHGEWCCCMAYTIPPCLEKKRVTDPKDWVPRCDKEGYYEREQCHESTGYCWCVDINGNNIVGTKTYGSAHCGKYDPNGRLDKQ